LRDDFRIGEWIIHPHVNSMERGGEAVHLEPKVMQVLRVLASEPGEVVPRDRLRSAVWPDVFVGEDVLIRAISELRRVFSDDPRSPHTIQTVPKVGYRLIVPVSRASVTSPIDPGALTMRTGEVSGPEKVEAGGIATAPNATTLVSPSSKIGTSKFGLGLLMPAVALLALAGVIWATFGIWSAYRSKAIGTYTSRPFTTYPGSELTAAFAPDGSAIAFVWRKEGERHGYIYVKLLNSEAPVRLSAGIVDEICPAWSPDGRWIAFIRHDETHSIIVTIPANGGSEHEVYRLPTNSVWEYGGLVWTADGNNLIFPQRRTVEAPSELVELSLSDRTARAITTPQHGWDGDWTPVISPDGKKLAFVRGGPGLFARDIFTMELPNGEPQQLTHDGSLIVGLTWTADSSAIVFSSNRRGSLSLWKISARGGTAEREPVGGDDAYGPSIARQGNRLVYSHGSAAWKIIGANLAGKDGEADVEILSSSVQDASPHISPGGDKIAFQSWRSGSQEIWTAGIDGNNPVQLTSKGTVAGSPAWSRDGQRIAFDARPDSFAHIYVIDATGSAPRTITQGHFNDIVPAWSVDGHWLYFGSNRSGAWQIWRTPSDGSGSAEQVTTGGGMVALESGDAQWLYFTKYGESGIWRRAISGGPERKIFDGPPSGSQNYWTLGGGSVYSLSDQGGRFSLQRIDPETGHTDTVHVLKHDPTPFAGLSVTPDGKLIVFAELARASSDLTLVEHFQ
jgi:Tol biopolymer transport system component/DNA-binding winged helix-turn-helix (wHTH) protein